MNARRFATAALLASLVSALLPLRASAHPLGNFSINHEVAVEVAGAQLDLTYYADIAEIPTFSEQQRIADDPSYLDAHVKELSGQIALTIDGMPTRPMLVDRRIEFPAGQGGLPTTRLALLFSSPLGRGEHHVDVSDGTYAGRLGWREMTARASHGAAIAGSTVPEVSSSDDLRRYPESQLSSPLHVSSATFTATPSVAAGLAPILRNAPRGLVAITDRYAALVQTPDAGIVALIGVLSAAVALGAAHALSPGHGKAVMAAYLVGARRTRRDAFLLAGTITVTHTIGVFALGVVTLSLSTVIRPERMYPLLTLVSAILLMALGGALVWKRVRSLRGASSPGHHHAGDVAHSHSHPHGGDRRREAEQPYGHSHVGAPHDHSPPERFRLTSIVTMGISGGLLPCPSALIVLLAALQLHRMALGVVLIIAFSVGLSVTLTCIGVAVATGAPFLRRVARRPGFRVFERTGRIMSVGSAAFIAAIGALLTIQAVSGLQ